MKLLVGLGNPGEGYTTTRHNAGFLFLDYIVDKLKGQGVAVGDWQKESKFKALILEITANKEKIVLLKPQTYMNESGWSVKQYMAWHKISPEKLLVVHDDLDIRLGEYKANTNKSPKVHYGILSIEGYLKTKDFQRIRIGVDNRDEQNRTHGVDYVMQHFSGDEKQLLEDTFSHAYAQVERFMEYTHAKR